MEPVPEIVEMVLKFIRETGGALAQAGFEISVKFVIAQAIANLIKALICAVMAILSIRYIFNLAKKNEGEELITTNAEGVALICSLIFGVIGILGFAFSSPFESVTRLISPEWFAILNIIDLVK